jgi:hypothetical protein
MKLHLILFVIFSACCFSLQAQTPATSLVEEEEEVDTIYYEEEPVIFQQKLIVHSEKQVKFYLSGYASLFANHNYYIPCDGWESRVDQYKTTIDPSLNYGAGITLSYAPHKIILSGGLDYSVIREVFHYTDEENYSFESHNHFNYIDLSLTAGYWMGRDNKIASMIFSGGATYNYLLSQSGLIFDVKNAGSVIDVSDSEKLRTHQYSLTASCKFILSPQHRIKYTLEPYYMGSIATITQDKYPYLQYYNRMGLRFGVIFSM